MYRDEVNEKMQAGSLRGIGVEMPRRSTLTERVHSQLNDAVYTAQKAERLQELAGLLERNPEVARILDLVDEVRG